MSHSIKVSDDTYSRLERMLRPRESFNDVVVRALDVYDTIKTVSDTLGPDHYLHKPPKEVIFGHHKTD